MFSASAGSKCLRHPVVFGTPQSVKNRIGRFGDRFCAVFVDEAHGMTKTVQAIIDALRARNPALRVMGTTATPFRLGSGYIYASEEDGRPMGEHACLDPYFSRKVFTIGAHMLIQQGYLTQPVVGKTSGEHYNTIGMRTNTLGRFSSQDVDVAYHGHGRKTAQIVADVVARSSNRRGVLVYAATIQHAEEVLASLPPQISRIVTGKTGRQERKEILRGFIGGRIKYLVNVDVLTTGFDAPHVDVIAMLRATESVGLMQQIIGRGLRLADGKTDCLVLDYAENIARHCPDGDLFDPTIKAGFRSADSETLQAECPQCKVVNEFSRRPNPDGYKISEQGYFLDLDGHPLDMPAHFGRRCKAQWPVKGGRLEQCSYRWTGKECPACGQDNDIAARRCSECRAELVDPNEKLRLDFAKFKRDPTQIQTDQVLDWALMPTISRAGNECLRIDYTTPYRRFSVWLMPNATTRPQMAAWAQFQSSTDGGKEKPSTVTYRKDSQSGMYRVFDYNRPADEVPSVD
jgi:DNA repair protein RadD